MNKEGGVVCWHVEMKRFACVCSRKSSWSRMGGRTGPGPGQWQEDKWVPWEAAWGQAIHLATWYGKEKVVVSGFSVT